MSMDPVAVIDEFLLRNDPQLRINAVVALGTIPTLASTERLINRALDDQDTRVRQSAENELVERLATGDPHVLKLYEEEEDSRRKREFYALLGRLRVKGAKIPSLSGGWGSALWLFGIAYPERGARFYFRTFGAALGGAIATFFLMTMILSVVASTTGLNGGLNSDLSKGVGIGALIGVLLAAFASARTTAWPLHGARRGPVVEVLLAFGCAAAAYALLAVPFTLATHADKENLTALGIMIVIAVALVRVFTILGGATGKSRWANFLVAAVTGMAGSMLCCSVLLHWLAAIDASLFSQFWVIILPACGPLSAGFASIDARVPIAWRSRFRVVASGLVIALFVVVLADLGIASYLMRKARSTLMELASQKLPVGATIVSASGGGFLEVGMLPYRGQLNIQERIRVGLAWPGETSVTLAHGARPVVTSADSIEIVIDKGLYDVYYGLGSSSNEKTELTQSEALSATVDAALKPFRPRQVILKPEHITPRLIQVSFSNPRSPYGYTDTIAIDTAMTAIDTAMTDTMATYAIATDTMATDTTATSMTTDTSATTATSATSTSDPGVGTSRRIAAQSQLNAGVSYALEGRIGRALDAFREARMFDPNLPIPSTAWNTLCWNAALHGRAVDVVDGACEYAVSQTPDDYRFKDSRGVARALTGKYAEAIKDFQPYVSAVPDPARRAQRQRWIETLKKNQNPITPEEIKGLLAQSITPGPRS